MKRQLLFFVVFILLFSKSYSQCDSTKLCYYNRDTISYFRNVFESNKSNYLNYPLIKMINNFEAKPIYYYYGITYKNIEKCNRIYLYFTPANTYNRSTKVKIKLIIYFKELISEDSCVKQDIADKGFWLHSTRQFYGNRIIKDFEFIEVQY